MNFVCLNFICNFKPNWDLKKKNIKKKIFCKNFIVFMMFLKFYKNVNNTIFIKPKKRKNFSIPKAPHRYKLSKHLLYFQRYEILITIKINNSLYDYNLDKLIYLFKNLFFFFRKIDSTLCYQKYLKLSFNVQSRNLLN